MNKYVIGLSVVVVLLIGYFIGYMVFHEEPSVNVCPNYNVTCEECSPVYNQSKANYHNEPAKDYKEEHKEKYNITEPDRRSARDKIDDVLERFN